MIGKNIFAKMEFNITGNILRSPSYLDCIEGILKNKPTMIMCIVPNNSADRYSAIKKKCCVDRGVPTQVIVARNLTAKGKLN